MITVTMMEQSQPLGNIVILTLTSQVNGEIWIFLFCLAMYVQTLRYESIMIHFFSSVRYPVMTRALTKVGRPIFFSLCEW